MNPRRIATLAIVLATLGVVALGWFVGASPLLNQANLASDELAAVQAENVRQQQRLDTLREQYQNLPALLSALQEAEGSIPRDADIEGFIEQLGTLDPRPEWLEILTAAHLSVEGYQEALAAVTVTSITLGEPVIYGGVPTVAPESEAPPVATDASGLSPELAAISYTVPVTLTVVGPTDPALLFLTVAQSGSRLWLVTDVAIGGIGGGDLSMTMSGHLFVLRDPRAADIVFPDPQASPTPTPTPTATATAEPMDGATPAPTP